MKSANLIIDYLTFSSKCDSVKSIIDFLGFSEIPFAELVERMVKNDMAIVEREIKISSIR